MHTDMHSLYKMGRIPPPLGCILTEDAFQSIATDFKFLILLDHTWSRVFKTSVYSFVAYVVLVQDDQQFHCMSSLGHIGRGEKKRIWSCIQELPKMPYWCGTLKDLATCSMVSLMESGTLTESGLIMVQLLPWYYYSQETRAEWCHVVRKRCGNDVGRKTCSDPKSNTIWGISKHSFSQTDQLSQQHSYENKTSGDLELYLS